METAPVRVWSGIHEALQIYTAETGNDMSATASLLIMGAMFEQEDLPEKSQVALVRTFFELVGEQILLQKQNVAEWVVNFLKQAKHGVGAAKRLKLGEAYERGTKGK